MIRRTARAAFAHALVLDAGNAEAHFYLGLVELLLVAESDAVADVFAAANAELRIDWSEGMIETDWRELAVARSSIEEAVGWKFASQPGAEGGDVLRGLGGEHAYLDFAFISLTAASITGPGTIRFRVRSEGLSSGYLGLEVFAMHVSERLGRGARIPRTDG